LGLTVRDFQNAVWNGVNNGVMFFGCMAIAAAANALSRAILPDDAQKKASRMKHGVCTAIGASVGVLVCFQYADRLHQIAFSADKAFKFGIISCFIGPITLGGVTGYFGRNVFLIAGTLGSITGSAIVTASTYLSSFI
jgi:hypothetical protein